MSRGGWRFGAGRPSSRQRVENCRSIDIRRFSREGMLQDALVQFWSWKNAGTGDVTYRIRVSANPNALCLRYTWHAVAMDERIGLQYSGCGFGGRRPWFSCPGCQCRVAILYLHNGAFRCRRCHDLRYACQSEDAIDRTWRAQVKVEGKMSPGQRKRKGMHNKTHDRLIAKAEEAEWERRLLMCAGYRRLMGLD